MSRADAQIIVSIFAYLTLFTQIFLVVLILFFLISRANKKIKFVNQVVKFFSDNSLPLAFFVALVAMSGSLFFSEVAHYIPCKLCWYQRICMYPQVLLLGVANLKNDFGIKKYVLPLSIIGIIIASYHYLLQMSPLPLPCTDEIASCALKQIGYFGYITIPLMSLTAFALIITLHVLTKKK